MSEETKKRIYRAANEADTSGSSAIVAANKSNTKKTGHGKKSREPANLREQFFGALDAKQKEQYDFDSLTSTEADLNAFALEKEALSSDQTVSTSARPAKTNMAVQKRRKQAQREPKARKVLRVPKTARQKMVVGSIAPPPFVLPQNGSIAQAPFASHRFVSQTSPAQVAAEKRSANDALKLPQSKPARHREADKALTQEIPPQTALPPNRQSAVPARPIQQNAGPQAQPLRSAPVSLSQPIVKQPAVQTPQPQQSIQDVRPPQPMSNIQTVVPTPPPRNPVPQQGVQPVPAPPLQTASKMPVTAAMPQPQPPQKTQPVVQQPQMPPAAHAQTAVAASVTPKPQGLNLTPRTHRRSHNTALDSEPKPNGPATQDSVYQQLIHAQRSVAAPDAEQRPNLQTAQKQAKV